jgi:hypothetical protein
MMSHSVPPQNELELLTWAKNASSKLTESGANFGIGPESASSFASSYSKFADLMAKMENPDLRTPNVRIQKDVQKRNLTNACRGVIRAVKAHFGVSDAQLTDLRIPIPDRERTRIDPPEAIPNLLVSEVMGRHVTIELRDEEGKRRKPKGVKGANVYTFVGDTPPDDLDAWKFEGGTTKTKLTHPFRRRSSRARRSGSSRSTSTRGCRPAMRAIRSLPTRPAAQWRGRREGGNAEVGMLNAEWPEAVPRSAASVSALSFLIQRSSFRVATFCIPHSHFLLRPPCSLFHVIKLPSVLRRRRICRSSMRCRSSTARRWASCITRRWKARWRRGMF